MADTDKKYAYYCEVTRDSVWAVIKPGVYVGYGSPSDTRGLGPLFTVSNKIWRQGPRGGVKIIKDREKHDWGQMQPTQYVTKNQDLMKEFMVVKLKANLFSTRS